MVEVGSMRINAVMLRALRVPCCWRIVAGENPQHNASDIMRSDDRRNYREAQERLMPITSFIGTKVRDNKSRLARYAGGAFAPFSARRSRIPVRVECPAMHTITTLGIAHINKGHLLGVTHATLRVGNTGSDHRHRNHDPQMVISWCRLWLASNARDELFT